MRRITLWLAATVTIVVLLFGYHTSTNSAATPAQSSTSSSPAGSGSGSGSAGSSGSGGSSGSSGSSAPSPSSSPSASSDSSSSSGTTTYTGSIAQTRWGPVQVKITVGSGKVTAVDVVEYPTENPRDVEINDQALPLLVQETLDAQSADIDMVSGATVTSEGYLQSLQAALDEAGI